MPAVTGRRPDTLSPKPSLSVSLSRISARTVCDDTVTHLNRLLVISGNGHVQGGVGGCYACIDVVAFLLLALASSAVAQEASEGRNVVGVRSLVELACLHQVLHRHAGARRPGHETADQRKTEHQGSHPSGQKS